MSEKSKIDNLTKVTDPVVHDVLTEAMNLLKKSGLRPIILVVSLPNGQTVDMPNPEICGACITELLGKMEKIHKAAFPKHENNVYHNPGLN